MEGWCSAEDLVRWAFAHAPVVMANEAHSGLARCYLAQPDMRRLIGTALDLGWTLSAYEAVIEITPDTDQEHLRSMEFTNWREREQAANWCRLLEAAPGELLASVADMLAAYGGTAGILRDQAPPPLDGRVGNDAFVVSTDNEMTA